MPWKNLNLRKQNSFDEIANVAFLQALYYITLMMSSPKYVNVLEKNFLYYANNVILNLANLLTLQFAVLHYINLMQYHRRRSLKISYYKKIVGEDKI